MEKSGFKVGCRKFLIFSILTVFCSVNLIPANLARAENLREEIGKTIVNFQSSSLMTGEILGKEKAAREEIKTYHQVMKDVVKWQKNKENKQKAVNGLIDLIAAEKEKMADLGVDENKQEEYLNRLNQQLDVLEGREIKDGLGDKVKDIFTKDEDARDVKLLKDGSKFKFSEQEIKVEKLEDAVLKLTSGQKIEEELKELFKVERVDAAMINPFYPVIADIKEDAEVKITVEIKDLAESLEYNPVKILNYVKNNIKYEPYFGAKKGALGCLLEQKCNDYDGASLTIALLRASNIPARYQKSLSIIRVEELQKLLGVDETKTVYLALAINKVPVFTVSGNDLPENIDEADFSAETHLAVQWVHPEMFYEYDERGADFANDLDLSGVITDEELQTLLIKYPKKQWVPLEPMLKKFNHDKKEILADTANFNSENFWYNQFQYQGFLSPLDKYKQDLQTVTGKNVSDYLSTKTIVNEEMDIAPILLPYIQAEAENYPITDFSSISDVDRHQVKMILKREDNNQTVLEKTFFGNEINNQELTLSYQGATESDQAIIESYGGLHLTPAELVKIKAFFTLNELETTMGTESLDIGEALVLRFEYAVNNYALGNDEKFSTAGNNEGIYLTLSEYLDDDPELLDNRMVVFKGNLGFAQKYLSKLEEEGKILKQSLDYEYNLRYARAVVTQTRILNRFNGVPTTFDFKGYQLDASVYINDWSNRGNYKTHQKDFRLLWGQSASYQEGQMFTDVSGLSAISTVKGLQYAYAHPESYTVKKITSANKSDIDNLDLSDNTKANMKADVDQGNTILTPNKIVDAGVWHGLFYVSLNPQWTGTYAIGEQVMGNGAWTNDEMTEECLQNSLVSSNNPNMCAMTRDVGNDKFLFQDREKSYQTISCKIDKTRFQAIKDSKYDYVKYPNEWQRWKESYGFPCMEICDQSYCVKKSKQYVSITHSYIFASLGAKFFSPGNYDYWVTESDVKDVLIRDKDNDKLNGKPTDIKLGGTFKFNPIAATYSYFGSGDYDYDGKQGDENDYNLTAYYQPDKNLVNNKRGKGRIVYGKILDKLIEIHYNPGYICESDDTYCGKYNFVLYKLGYPIDNQRAAGQSDFGTEGYYQNFIGGQVYLKKSGVANYVPGKIYEYYDSKNGTNGKFGFPESDPFYKGNILRQNFEGTRIDQKSDGTVSHSPVWYKYKDGHHFLIVDLNPNLENRACFKHYIGLQDGVKIEDGVKNFKDRAFKDIINSTVESVKNNRQLNYYEPIAAVNGDFFNENGLQSINYSLGTRFSGNGHPVSGIWASMAISLNNIVEITFENKDKYFNEKWNVVGGGPLIIGKMENGVMKDLGKFTEKKCRDFFGFNKGHDPCSFWLNQRTIAGITDKNYMIVFVSPGADFEKLGDLMNSFSNMYGKVQFANMFDGGGSSALMFDGEIKQTKKPLASLFLIYEGQACK